MVGIGRTLLIQDELYEIIRTLRVKTGGVLTSEQITELKELWHAEKAFKQADTSLIADCQDRRANCNLPWSMEC